MKIQVMPVIVLLLIATLILVGCENPTKINEGDVVAHPVKIRVNNNSLKTIPAGVAIGDSICDRGDLTVVKDNHLFELFSNGPSNAVVSQGIWHADSEIDSFSTRAVMWKDESRIYGIRYKAKHYPKSTALNLNFDLEYGDTPVPLNKVYQAKTNPITADSLHLPMYLGPYDGVSCNDGQWHSYGTHYKSEEIVETVWWTGHADSTTTGNGMVPLTITNMDEIIGPGMDIWIATSWNDMELEPAIYDPTRNAYYLNFTTLPSHSDCEVRQNVYVIDRSNHSIKRFGVQISSYVETEELINVVDYDPDPDIDFPVFVYRNKQNGGVENLFWMDTRLNFDYTEFIPH